MSSHIDDVRKHLFETLQSLRDPAAPMDLDRAKAVVSVAQTLIESAKVEVDYLRVTGTDNSNFLEPKPTRPDLGRTPGQSTPPLSNGVEAVTRHLIK